MSRWQPIETAPKDGTRILAFSPGAPKHGYQAVHIDLWMNNGWWHCNGTFWPNTHWMPLPEAPK